MTPGAPKRYSAATARSVAMSEFELLRDITIGQYLPTNSIIHRLDPRAKLLAAAAVITAITFTSSYIGNLLLLAAVLGIVTTARIPLSYAARGLRPALPVMVVLALMQLLFFGRNLDPNSPVVLSFGFVVITAATVKLVVVSALRFVQLILLTSVVTFSTTITELTHGVEGLLRPLRPLRVPSHELALILTIALRFVPTFALELERIMKAQASRGANLGTGGRWGRWHFIRRTRYLLPLIVPLFTTALQRAEELIEAMEARGYVGGDGRTQLVRLQLTAVDVAMVLVAVAVAVCMLLFPFPL